MKGESQPVTTKISFEDFPTKKKEEKPILLRLINFVNIAHKSIMNEWHFLNYMQLYKNFN